MNIITTTYAGPDLDGYGCAVAYAELLSANGEDAQAHLWGEPQLEVQWLIETFDLPKAGGPSDEAQAKVVLLDASRPEDLPSPLSADQVIEIIDHRRVHKAALFPNAQVHIERVGAAATLVAERFAAQEITPSSSSALYLLGGIISNTANFQSNTTARDTKMAGWLEGLCHPPADLAERMFAAKSDLSGDRLEKTLWGDLKTFVICKQRFAIAQIEINNTELLLQERREDIVETLKCISDKHQSDHVFVILKDLKTHVSRVVCLHKLTTELLEALPGVTCEGLLCTLDHFNRKKIVALLEEYLIHQK